MKAKWVRIELRKVETLPGGGVANTFFDFVGQSPISLWQSGEEYSTLSSVRPVARLGLACGFKRSLRLREFSLS